MLVKQSRSFKTNRQIKLKDTIVTDSKNNQPNDDQPKDLAISGQKGELATNADVAKSLVLMPVKLSDLATEKPWFRYQVFGGNFVFMLADKNDPDAFNPNDKIEFVKFLKLVLGVTPSPNVAKVSSGMKNSHIDWLRFNRWADDEIEEAIKEFNPKIPIGNYKKLQEHYEAMSTACDLKTEKKNEDPAKDEYYSFLERMYLKEREVLQSELPEIFQFKF